MPREYPPREQRSPVDVFPGMTFFFQPDPNVNTASFNRMMDDARDGLDITVPWTVIGKEQVTKISGGYVRYLLLGPGPTLHWFEGRLGWIRRVADPVWEERYANGWGTTLGHL